VAPVPGAAPVIARAARELGALTVGIVTMPFGFEGKRRSEAAQTGLQALQESVDTLIVVPNDRLLEVLERGVSMVDAFRMADDVLRQGVQGICDLITRPGVINLDFADVRTVMQQSGSALMGIGMATGPARGREGRTPRARFAADRAAHPWRHGRAALDHGPRGSDAARGHRGGRGRARGGRRSGQHHLRHVRRRDARRPALGDGDRNRVERRDGLRSSEPSGRATARRCASSRTTTTISTSRPSCATETVRGAIAAGHPVTAEAGAAVLRAGGSAVDACVAAASPPGSPSRR